MIAEARKRPSLTSGATIMTASRFVAVGLSYLLNVFLARHLSVPAFGLLGVVITVLMWLELVVAEGLPLWIVRVVDPDAKGPIVRGRYVAAQLGVAFLLAGALALAAPLLATVFAQTGTLAPFRLAAIDIPIFALYNLALAALLGSQSYTFEGLSTGGYALTKLVATVAFVLAGMSVIGAVLGSVTASVGGLAITLVLVAVRFRGRRWFGDAPVVPRASDGDGVPLPSLPDGGAVAGATVPATLIVSQTLALSLDLWMVKALLPAAQAGYYRGASLIAQVPFALSSGLVWGLFAAYSDARRRGDVERQRHYVSQSVRLLVAAASLWVALVVPTARALLITIGFPAAYGAGAPVLMLLTTGTAIGMVAVAVGPTLLLEGRGRAVLGTAIGLVAAEAVAAYLLIPRMGAKGAALAAGGAFAIAGVAALIALRERLAFPLASTLLRLVAPAAVVGLAAAALRPAAGPALIGWYVVASALYAGLLFVTRGLTRRDIESIREGFER